MPRGLRAGAFRYVRLLGPLWIGFVRSRSTRHRPRLNACEFVCGLACSLKHGVAFADKGNEARDCTLPERSPNHSRTGTWAAGISCGFGMAGTGMVALSYDAPDPDLTEEWKCGWIVAIQVLFRDFVVSTKAGDWATRTWAGWLWQRRHVVRHATPHALRR